MVGHYNDKDVDNTDILLSYLLTCDPPADVNDRSITYGTSPLWISAARYNSTSTVKVLIDFGGDCTSLKKSVVLQ